MSQYSIPVVDLADYQSGTKQGKEKFIEAIGKSLKDVGFFALMNHSIEQNLVQKGYSEVANFFSSSTNIKTKYEIKGLHGQRGYTPFGKEHAKNAKAPDLKEFWHLGQEILDEELARKFDYPKNIWPAELPEFRPVMLELFTKLESCALSILEACALYIGENADTIRDYAVHGNSILRLIHYPPIPAERDPQSVRAAAHEDINLITLLVDATTSGLEILDREGKWLPVVTPEGCIVVDAGDMLQNLSNGFYKSTTHRVVNPDNSRLARYSMPFFVHARGDVSLDPLASCVAITGGQRLFPDITAEQYLQQRLFEIGLTQ